MAKTVPVRFEPHGVTVWVECGSTLLEAARKAAEPIDAPCAGRGVCGGCAVRITSGSVAPPDEQELVGLRRAPSGVRLACRAVVQGPVTVCPVVPRAPHAFVPGTRAKRIGAESAAAGQVPLVAAVDLGTSTVGAVVIERDSRVEVGRGVVSNQQSAWGADVLSRISSACAGEGAPLRKAAEASVLDALAAACTDEGLCLKGIERLVIAGNSAMTGLLLGVDVSGLAAHPFTAPMFEPRPLPDNSAIAAALAAGAVTVVLPPLAGFVGGDVLAGLVAEGLNAGGRALFVDLGTNAEVVDAREGRFVVASAAAGPAFEGGGLSRGGPAVAGAIERVALDPEQGLNVEVVGGGAPLWLCGSGFVSAVALLRRLGHLDEDGLLVPEGPLAERMSVRDGVRTFTITAGSPQQGAGPTCEEGQPDVVLTQLDVRALQLAKAAVRSAIEAVSSRARVGGNCHGEGAEDLEVIIAGGFGSALEVDDLVDLGVLPTEYRRRARIVGNASLLGAAMIAVDHGLEDGVARLAGNVEHVELALEAGFTGRYLSALSLAPYSLRSKT